VVKELVDNALDAGASCEFAAHRDGRVVVEDRGDEDGLGIEPDAAPTLFSTGRPLLSTKKLRLPTRGALGNGLRVVAGAVRASGGELVVESRGERRRLEPQDDGTTRVVERAPSPRSVGTRVELRLGPALRGDLGAREWGDRALRL